MKDIISKRFWIIFWTLNSCFALLYIAFAFINFTLILGHIAGCLTFSFFIYLTSLLYKQKNSNKNTTIKLKKTKNVALFMLISIGSLMLVFLFFMVNYLYRKYVDKNINLFLKVINFITFATPFIIFTISLFIEIVLEKKDLKQTKKAGVNG